MPFLNDNRRKQRARDRVAGAYGRGKVPSHAEVGGAGQEVTGCRSRLHRTSNGHLKLYAKHFFSVQFTQLHVGAVNLCNQFN